MRAPRCRRYTSSTLASLPPSLRSFVFPPSSPSSSCLSPSSPRFAASPLHHHHHHHLPLSTTCSYYLLSSSSFFSFIPTRGYTPALLLSCFEAVVIHENVGRTSGLCSVCVCVRRHEDRGSTSERARVRVRPVLRARDRRGAPSMCESPAWRCHIAREWKEKNREREVTCECRTCL